MGSFLSIAFSYQFSFNLRTGNVVAVICTVCMWLFWYVSSSPSRVCSSYSWYETFLFWEGMFPFFGFGGRIDNNRMVVGVEGRWRACGNSKLIVFGRVGGRLSLRCFPGGPSPLHPNGLKQSYNWLRQTHSDL